MTVSTIKDIVIILNGILIFIVGIFNACNINNIVDNKNKKFKIEVAESKVRLNILYREREDKLVSEITALKKDIF